MSLKIKLVQDLLKWVELNLKNEREFTENDIENYFAESFVINTNGRIVTANPLTYKKYLYQLKKRLGRVRYTVEELFEADQSVVAVFIIHLDFLEKTSHHLRAISIFKFNDQDKIVEWLEVFRDALEKKMVYDPL